MSLTTLDTYCKRNDAVFASLLLACLIWYNLHNIMLSTFIHVTVNVSYIPFSLFLHSTINISVPLCFAYCEYCCKKASLQGTDFTHVEFWNLILVLLLKIVWKNTMVFFIAAVWFNRFCPSSNFSTSSPIFAVLLFYCYYNHPIMCEGDISLWFKWAQ